MEVTQLLDNLQRRGVRLSVTGDNLQIGAPKGSITSDLRSALSDNKAALIALLREPAKPSNGKDESAPWVGMRARYVETNGTEPVVRRQEGKPLEGADILRNAQQLAPELRNHGERIEEARRLPADIVAKLLEAGVFRMNMPRIWGGPEMTSMEQNEVIEELSRANASVGWCVMIGSDSGIVSSYLEDSVAREMYPRLDMVQAGWYIPVGTARKVPGGYRVTGKWRFASGCTHCNWMSAGCRLVDSTRQVDTQDPLSSWRVMMAPPSEFEIIDSWHTMGLRGSGSLDYRCEDLFVPDEHSFSFFETPKRAGALYASPDTYLRKMPGIPLGIARDAIDTVREIMENKREVPSGVPYRELPRVQAAIARAEGLYASSRAYMYASLEKQWQILEAGGQLSKKERGDLWLSRINVFQSAREVVQLMFDMVGAGAIYSQESPLDRHLRDVTTIAQHVVGQNKSYEPVGAMLMDPAGNAKVPFL